MNLGSSTALSRGPTNLPERRLLVPPLRLYKYPDGPCSSVGERALRRSGEEGGTQGGCVCPEKDGRKIDVTGEEQNWPMKGQ